MARLRQKTPGLPQTTAREGECGSRALLAPPPSQTLRPGPASTPAPNGVGLQGEKPSGGRAAIPDKPGGTGHPPGGLYKERLVYKLLESQLEMVIVLTPTSLAISA